MTLLGFSLGARVVFQTLEQLAKSGNAGIVDHAILMGGALTARSERWEAAREVVAGRFVNAYCTSDWVLAFLYRAAELESDAAGLGPIEIDRVDNFDVTDLVGGHLGYRSNLRAVLERIGVDGSEPRA